MFTAVDCSFYYQCPAMHRIEFNIRAYCYKQLFADAGINLTRIGYPNMSGITILICDLPLHECGDMAL